MSTMTRRRSALYVPRAPALTPYPTQVMADTPLAYWRMGEASGGPNTLVDSSGNGRHGTYNSGATPGTTGLLSGDTDTAATFNGGTAAYAQTLYGSWMNVATITLEAVIKPAVVGGNPLILDRDGFSGIRSWMFRLNGSKLEFLFWTTTGGPFFCDGTTVLTVGTTYHAAATYDGTTARVYLNGVADGSLSQSGTLQNTSTVCPLTIGANYEPNSVGFTGFWNGVIDEAAVYGSALSGARIAAHNAAR